MISRREFLRNSSLVSLSPLVPTVFRTAAYAAAAERDANVLVVIQLDGGNDGINTVVPYGDDGYGRARDKLRLKVNELHKLDEHVGLHPQMRAAKELMDDGRLTIVQGVGYPNPNRSHFRSMKIWQTARFDVEAHDEYGWLGRALDRASSQHRRGEPMAVYVGQDEVPVALWGRRTSTTTLTRIDDVKLDIPANQLTAAFPRAATARGPGKTLHDFVTDQMLFAYTSAHQLQQQAVAAGTGDSTSGPYPPTRIGSRLKLISQLLRNGSAARVYYTAQSGYDTHASQLYTHARLLNEFSSALKSFLDDLRFTGLDRRVLVLAFSEFGRRVQENASQGTDHGTAGPVLVAGSQVAGGLLGKAPDLSDLDAGDLKMSIDFRQVYATLLDHWLGVSARDVLGASFDTLPLLRTSN